MESRSTPPPSLRSWLSLVGHRWTEVVRHRAVNAVLAVVAAALGLAFYVWHVAWAPLVIAVITLSWAALAVPIAAYSIWRDDRLARIAAEDSISSQFPETLRPAAFRLAREIRLWLRSLSDDELSPTEDEHAIRYGFETRFRADVLKVWDRLTVALFPDHNWSFDQYLANDKISRKNIAILANDLEIFVKRVPTDFLAE